MAKGLEKAEKAADIARKAEVHKANVRREKLLADEEKRLANTPLTAEERAFIAEMMPRMNEGRSIMKPTPAEIGRLARLRKRENVK